MVDERKAKKKLKRRIDNMSDAEAKRKANDKSRFRKWVESVVGAAWDVVKGAIGSFLSGLL